jgi:hypothetical protein
MSSLVRRMQPEDTKRPMVDGWLFDDRDFIVAEAPSGPHCSSEVLGAEAPIHSHSMVVAGQHVAERVDHLGFQSGRQLGRPPRFAKLALGGSSVALDDQYPREREPSQGVGRGRPGEEMAHRGAVAALLP